MNFARNLGKLHLEILSKSIKIYIFRSKIFKNLSKIFVSPNTKKYKPDLTLKDREQL